MKRIVNYKTFINESAGASTLTSEQIDFLNNYVKGKWKLNGEGFIDIDGDFSCFDKGLSDFRWIKFGKVTGYFYCSYNGLTSLEGAPKKVGLSFYCHNNKLTSLDGSPKEIGGNFDCSDNKLTSLEFSPESVKGSFDCSYNNLTSLEFGPKEVGGDLRFSHNEGLSTKTIGLIFDKMEKSKLDYKTVLKSLWKEIPIEDKILLYNADLDWIEGDEAAKLAKLNKYSNIKKMI